MKGETLSHISKIELEIKDLEALKNACNTLGFQFMENQKEYIWYGKWIGNQPLPPGITEDDIGKCDHAIRVPTAQFEVGVVRKGNSWILLWDNWIAGGLQKVIGKDAGILKQAYSVEAVKKISRVKGYRIVQKKLRGKIRLFLNLP
jgi:hypothetical protein